AARLLPPEPKKKRVTETVPTGASAPADLSESERTLFNLLSTDEPSHIDALAETSKLSMPELSSALLALEMRDLVRQLPGKCFVRKL
ncbi:MAG: DNA-protecting protein DprA, partial [Acidobacteria bacterium]|nr:DNA-protecting protein DprA [Acidobacteriota bacterium]